jgi:cell division protein YceG involved in septum cleavage
MLPMKHQSPLLLPPPRPVVRRPQWLMVIVPSALMIALFVGAFGYAVYETRTIALESAHVTNTISNGKVLPFPLGVHPTRKLIAEDPSADSYLHDVAARSLARGSTKHMRHSALAFLASFSWFQQLATPSGRILIVEPGERKEEIAENIGRILGWNAEEKKQFRALVASTTVHFDEGGFFPATYVVGQSSSPEDVALLVSERFIAEVHARYSEEIARIVPLKDTLTIASLLEREAYGFEDMRIISGIIWNRLFAGMKLQLDATMQYAKGKEDAWWPIPTPSDKSIDSPFNTYLHAGLPPEPIANPSLDAIVAALNPKKTDCMFYFHDSSANFHCSVTYAEHVEKLKKYYGTGR